MVTISSVVFGGLKSLLSTTFMKVAMVALMLIPSLYTGFYLYSNYDPYTAMKNVPVAIANQDQAVTVDGNTFDLGRTISQELIDRQVFDMHQVDAEALRDGVYNEKYLFGLIIPEDFSANVSTLYSAVIGGGEVMPVAGQIILVSNDANNYIIHTAAEQLTGTLSATISSQVMRQFSDSLLKGLTTVHDNLKVASDGSAQMSAAIDELKANSVIINDSLQKLTSASQPLPDIMQQLSSGSQQIAAGDAEIDRYADQFRDIANRLDDLWTADIEPNLIDMINRLPDGPAKQFLLDEVAKLDQVIAKINSDINRDVDRVDELAAGARQLADGLEQLSAEVPTLVSAIGQLSSGYMAFDDGLGKLQAAAHLFSSQLELGYQKIPSFNDQQRDAINDVVAAPVTISDESQASSANYGVGLAPFFISLSTWVGAYALFVLFKPFKNKELQISKSNIKAGLGSYLIPLLLGLGQMIILFITVRFLLGLPIQHSLLLLLYMFLTSAAFTAIMFCLVALFEMAGLYIGLILLILQITSAGGTFPWQTTPYLFHILHQILPMSYSVDAMRHIINGSNFQIVHYDVLLMALYLVASLVLIVLITWWQRRRLAQKTALTAQK